MRLSRLFEVLRNHSVRIVTVSVLLALFVTIAAGVWCGALAQSTSDVRQYVQKARAAYKEKDYPALVENMKQALNLRPNYGPYTYNVAAGYALSGNKAEALDWLNRLADMGLVYEVAADNDFASIKHSNELKEVVRKFEDNAKPVGHSSTAFTLHEKGFVPEGIAYDPVEKVFYLSSVYKRKIVGINSAGEAKEFSSVSDGLWSVMGMRVDPVRRLLWVCTASHPQMMNFKEAEKGVSGVFKYDLKTKRLIKKYLLPSQPKPHWLGDLVLNSRGDVFTSDSISPAIYFLDHQKDTLELFLESDAFVNPQGLAFSADEKRMFMADYLKGLFVIDMKTKIHSLVTPAAHTTMLGLDGLYYHKGRLIGVQNGVNPNRLVEICLSADVATQVQKLEVLEANNPTFDEPTLAVLSGDTLYYIANSQWGMIDDKGSLAPEEKLREPIVLKLTLTANHQQQRPAEQRLKSDGSKADSNAEAMSKETFDRLKKLEGKWLGKSTKGWEETITFKTIAGGSVVHESSFDAHPNETMATMYFLDGNRLLLTHYCVSKTQPRLQATAFDDAGRKSPSRFLMQPVSRRATKATWIRSC